MAQVASQAQIPSLHVDKIAAPVQSSPLNVDEDGVQWEQARSANGVPFEIGRKKIEYGQSKPPSAPDGLVTAKRDFGVIVNWPVGGEGWKQTDPSVQNTAAITQYKLYHYTGALYGDFKLEFSNTEHYNYHFHDETGDSYEVNTWVNSDHSLRYKSDNPNMVYVDGS